MPKSKNKRRKTVKPKQKKVRNKGKKLPFIVHACPVPPLFPTHTHGLTKIGMPEFILDPLAFIPVINILTINRVYVCLNSNKNNGWLDSIKKGQTIKLTTNDLYPDKNLSINDVYCLRRVDPCFEAVKLAYEEGTHPGMWFVQIYIDGDDFALTDEYYRGGVTF